MGAVIWVIFAFFLTIATNLLSFEVFLAIQHFQSLRPISNPFKDE